MRDWRPGSALGVIAAAGLVAVIVMIALVVGRGDGGDAAASAGSGVLARPTPQAQTAPLFDVGSLPSFATSWPVTPGAGAPGRRGARPPRRRRPIR